ncbi:MAG: hypothetical protein AAB883_00680, partial [Patescibacteria group bacterium]
GNTYSKEDYNAKAKEFRFDADDIGKAWKQANEEHPDLTECRELLEVIPPVATTFQTATIEDVMNQSALEPDSRRTPLRAEPRL